MQLEPVVSRERLTDVLARAPPKETLVTLLSEAFHMGKEVAEHCIRLAKLDPKRCPEKTPVAAAEADALLGALEAGAELLRSLKTGDEATRGFLMLAPAAAVTEPVVEAAATEGGVSAADRAKQEVSHSFAGGAACL